MRSMAETNSAKIADADRVSVLYTSGVSGLDTNAKGSVQSQVIELVGAVNAVVVEDVSSKGGGNTINLEQLYQFDPDVILFSAGSIYQTVSSDEAWAQLRAVQNGSYCEIPSLPYNWMSNPPSLNMLALIINWNVDISSSSANSQTQAADPIPFSSSDMTEVPESAEAIEGGDLTKLGTVYYDEKTGSYYIVQNKEDAG